MCPCLLEQAPTRLRCYLEVFSTESGAGGLARFEKHETLILRFQGRQHLAVPGFVLSKDKANIVRIRTLCRAEKPQLEIVPLFTGPAKAQGL